MHIAQNRYVSATNASEGDRWADVGRFYAMCTGNSSASVTLGQIFASYTVTLSAPQIPESESNQITLVANKTQTVGSGQLLQAADWTVTQGLGFPGSAGLLSSGAPSVGALELALPKGNWWVDTFLQGVGVGNAANIGLYSVTGTNSSSVLKESRTSNDGTSVSSAYILDVFASAQGLLSANGLAWLTRPLASGTPFNLNVTPSGTLSMVAGVTSIVLHIFRQMKSVRSLLPGQDSVSGLVMRGEKGRFPSETASLSSGSSVVNRNIDNRVNVEIKASSSSGPGRYYD